MTPREAVAALTAVRAFTDPAVVALDLRAVDPRPACRVGIREKALRDRLQAVHELAVRVLEEAGAAPAGTTAAPGDTVAARPKAG